jgi:DNA replication protein DnaC
MAAPEALSATADREGDCPICGGGGFVRRKRALDDPNFGKVEPCSCVLSESEGVRRDRLGAISNLGSLARFTFATLDLDRADWLPEAAEIGRQFGADPRGWLVLSGPSGSGKTHLAAAIANARIAGGEPALVWVVPDLLDALRAAYRPDEGELGFQELFDQVKDHPFLVLDDIDATSDKPWAREKLFQVVNHRSNAQLPTVFTVSSKLSALDERLGSRLQDRALSRVLTLSAPAGATYEQVGGMTLERLAEYQFSDFAESSAWTPPERESFRSALVAARNWAEEPWGWLVIMGAHGCGKTHMAAAIANRRVRRGESVFFAVVPDLLDHLRGTFAPSNETAYDEVFDRVRNAGLLILDDLGAHRTSPWAEEKLYQIINYRTVSRLPTIVTTDLTPEGLRDTHPRAFARIMDTATSRTLEILAPHYSLGRMSAPKPPPARRAR